MFAEVTLSAADVRTILAEHVARQLPSAVIVVDVIAQTDGDYDMRVYVGHRVVLDIRKE